MALKISCVVVLYNPSSDISSRIASYASSVDKIYLIDNSEAPNNEISNMLRIQFENSEYISMRGNKGIAAALNEGFKHAIKDGYSWMLTMDQDSIFIEGAVEILKKTAEETPEDIAILAPYPQQEGVKRRVGYENRFIKLCLTSGNLVRTEAFTRVGGFDEKLFIDFVDHEFNLNLHRNSYKIILCGRAVLLHKLGETSFRRFLGIKVKTTNHNPIRRYYIARNVPYVLFKYFIDSPRLSLKFLRREFKEILKSVLFEENRSLKARNILRGWRDCIFGRFGKYPY